MTLISEQYSKIIGNNSQFETNVEGYSSSDSNENYFEAQRNYLPNQRYSNQNFIDQEKNDFIRKLTYFIQQQHFEYGKISIADRIVTEALNQDVLRTKNFLNEFFVFNFNKPSLLIGLLQIIASQPNEIINPEGYVMATAALSNKNIEVKECAVRCFENWVTKQSLTILGDIETSPKWLQEYIDNVKENIKEELCLIS
jgi:hypothetical protein